MDGAAALASLTQLRQLAIVQEDISRDAVAACAHLTSLTHLSLGPGAKYSSLRGTRGLTSLQALETLSLVTTDPGDPFPAPAAFPALRYYSYGVLALKHQPSLYVEPPAQVCALCGLTTCCWSLVAERLRIAVPRFPHRLTCLLLLACRATAQAPAAAAWDPLSAASAAAPCAWEASK